MSALHQDALREDRITAGAVNGAPTRVFVLDGHRVFAESLVDALGRCPDIIVVGFAMDVPRALAGLERVSVDVVLVDPANIGALSWSELRERARGASIAVLSDELSDQRSVAIHGARGWFGKREGLASLVEALPGLARGWAYFARDRLGTELESLTGRIRDLEAGITVFASLTPRERDVLGLLLEGRSRAEVARELFLSEATVRTHIEHVVSKLGAHSMLSAIATARRYGWERLLQRP